MSYWIKTRSKNFGESQVTTEYIDDRPFAPDFTLDRFRDQAARELESEIGELFAGGSNMIELTPERREAMQTAIILIDTAIREEKADPNCGLEVAGLTSDVEILRSMLERIEEGKG